MNYYLQMNGTSDYLKVENQVTFDRIVLDFAPRVGGTGVHVIDTRNGGNLAIHYEQDETMSIINTHENHQIYVNDTLLSSTSFQVPSGERVLLDYRHGSPVTDNFDILRHYTGVDFVKADLYDVKCYLGEELVLHYDISRGSTNDVVGVNHPRTIGGVWIQDIKNNTSEATISLMFAVEHVDVVLVVSASSNLSSPIFQSTETSTTNRALKVKVSNLNANTQYYYGVKIGGVLQNQGRGSFKTYPTGVSNFSCAFASCALTGSENEVFNTIRNLNPNFFIHMGDIHYEDITENNPELFREAYDKVFASTKQANLYANIPTVYMWDDHDFGGNNSRGSSPSKPAAQTVYKERVPHYPLNSPNDAMYQSFVCGRVRFIITDLRSNRDGSEGLLMGASQLQWFFSELLQPEPLKFWVTTVPWIASAQVGDDHWGGFEAQRTQIANFIKNNNLEGRVAILSGDMHALAIDDGTNSDYATGGGAKIPVFHAAALDQSAHMKGGPYKYGPYANGSNGNQFGLMNVTDDGERIDVEWQARRGASTLMTYSFSYPPRDPSEEPVIEPITSLPTNGLVLSTNILDSSTMTVIDGKVSQINDLSGLGNHVKQSNVTRQPTLVNNAHGTLPAIRLDGTSSALEVKPFTGHNLTNEMSLFMVLALRDANGGTAKIVDFSKDGFSNKSLHKSGSRDIIYTETLSSDDGISFSVVDEPFSYFLATHINSATNVYLYKNGQLAGQLDKVAIDLSETATIDIGRNANGLYYLDGDFAEIVVYNRAVQGDELAQINNYLKEKWGIS